MFLQIATISTLVVFFVYISTYVLIITERDTGTGRERERGREKERERVRDTKS